MNYVAPETVPATCDRVCDHCQGVIPESTYHVQLGLPESLEYPRFTSTYRAHTVCHYFFMTHVSNWGEEYPPEPNTFLAAMAKSWVG